MRDLWRPIADHLAEKCLRLIIENGDIITRVRHLHAPAVTDDGVKCAECRDHLGVVGHVPWPCRTIDAVMRPGRYKSNGDADA